MDDLIIRSVEVHAALHDKRPVVALESTLITHGLLWPENAATALAMEAAVRESGAVPATIAVLAGRITVGLSAEQIEDLAHRPFGSVRKCSRRDFPIVVARREDGATTVAGTRTRPRGAGCAGSWHVSRPSAATSTFATVPAEARDSARAFAGLSLVPAATSAKTAWLLTIRWR